MSRLTELLSRIKAKDPKIGNELAKEIKVLSARRQFGLNFERHKPENVELANREVRRGDKIRVLPQRGSTKNSDKRLWQVKDTFKKKNDHLATIELLGHDVAETQVVKVEDLIVVAEFQDSIYPGLISTGKVEKGKDKPYNTVINGENYHALKALTFTHKGKIDAIYIDPPYNTGAKDWKYNNDYVESDDHYRHSKWLAFMERRLVFAKKLLNPSCSVLIVTIDEKEINRLGLLLEQSFPEAQIQMISSVINPKGTGRALFSRTDEYIYYVFIGSAKVPDKVGKGEEKEVRWRYLRRTDDESARGTKKGGPAQFYPIYVNKNTHKIEVIGEPLKPEDDISKIKNINGCVAVFPIREKDEHHMNWGLTKPSLEKALSKGFVRVSRKEDSQIQPYVFSYLTAPNIKKIDNGILYKKGQREDGSWIVVDPSGKSSRPTTNWNEKSHEAGAYGTSLLKALIGKRKFPFPKSLYAVEDALRIVVGENKEAKVLDFFSGSGTTAHAVMRLNRQDNGERQCISITNNEVSADEQKALIKKGFRAGDPEWEKWGICDYITKPRIEAAITGVTPQGKPIEGEYKFNDEFPISDGFNENAEFFTLSYHTPLAVNHNLAFKQIAPLLWMKAGSRGKRIQELPERGWEVADSYALLVDLDKSSEFIKPVKASKSITMVFIVTNDDRRFQAIVRQLPESVEPVRLYESYLKNFQFTIE
ncbi:hypothetical protein GCM10023115_28340 [Pontixanthobacter gangjinensis]|uniref:Site-specific DNA-methyltransferase n=1 Tax=Christiangramia aestuarii TaxID=1028746 RepID=A0A7K1LMN5_9FLAO|nr:DNA methyltransferase [Christiangramia aestuarii]MUP42066.1 site-specific DNA-methyltransferase [Christiangramia aestuarii]